MNFVQTSYFTPSLSHHNHLLLNILCGLYLTVKERHNLYFKKFLNEKTLEITEHKKNTDLEPSVLVRTHLSLTGYLTLDNSSNAGVTMLFLPMAPWK